MARDIIIPGQIAREEIRSLTELPACGGSGGSVRVTVGRIDANGAFIVGAPEMAYTISGDSFAELTGAPTTWAPDKPAGTYRNNDLWHFIDILRG